MRIRYCLISVLNSQSKVNSRWVYDYFCCGQVETYKFHLILIVFSTKGRNIGFWLYIRASWTRLGSCHCLNSAKWVTIFVNCERIYVYLNTTLNAFFVIIGNWACRSRIWTIRRINDNLVCDSFSTCFKVIFNSHIKAIWHWVGGNCQWNWVEDPKFPLFWAWIVRAITTTKIRATRTCLGARYVYNGTSWVTRRISDFELRYLYTCF